MLAERDRLNAAIQEILDQQTDAWGIKVANIEIKDIDLAENMVRAIAKQAEAERLRRAKVINAEGEQQAAEKLVEAGRILAQEPQAMQLRYFAALVTLILPKRLYCPADNVTVGQVIAVVVNEVSKTPEKWNEPFLTEPYFIRHVLLS